MLQLFKINRVANRIHEWGEPGQYLWKQMGLTRVCGVALAAIEAISILYHSAFLLAWQLPVNLYNKSLDIFCAIIPRVKKLENIRCQPSHFEAATRNMLITIANIIAGLASSLFFGVIFSPEINFWLHRKLGLAVDNVGSRKEKVLKARLEAEVKAAAIRKDRDERLTQFQKERQATKSAEDQDDDAIDADLAKLFAS